MFSYQMSTRIEFGKGKARHLPDILATLHDQGEHHCFIVTDPGIERAGIVDSLVADLQSAGYEADIFHQVLPNPRDRDVMVGVDAFLQSGANVVIGVGGGSAMDTAKAIALIARSGGDPQDYVDNGRPYREVAPLVCVPTTAGTGSEVTRSSVITESSTHRKMTLKHERLRPLVAVLDVLLTLTVPPAVTAATGVDAFVHAIEGSTCTVTTPIARAFGMQAMKLILAALPQAYRDGMDVAARENMLMGSLLAGLCFGGTDVAAVHCLAEALGGLYDTPHGIANAVFLPYVLRFNAETTAEVHAVMARELGLASQDAGDQDAVLALLDAIEKQNQILAIPRLRELRGVQESDFERLVELSVKNSSTPSNIRRVTASDYRTLLEAAWLA